MRILAYLLLTLSLTGCDAGRFLDQLSQEWDALLIVMRGGQSPLAKHPKTQGFGRALSPSVAAARAKQNSQFLQEMLRVVYDRDVEDRAEFGNLLDTLNQGASLEGLYNGFTHSTDYRKLEAASPRAKPEALDFFAKELAATEVLLRVPTSFEENSTDEIVFPAPSASPSNRQSVENLEAKYKIDFANASIFTLKRVLSDEILKLVAEKSRDPKALQSWYGDWVVRMISQGVDFGIPLRNKPDAAFHANWAASADPDLLRWEILNRIHRILNAKNGAHT